MIEGEYRRRRKSALEWAHTPTKGMYTNIRHENCSDLVSLYNMKCNTCSTAMTADGAERR
jgi:uncharacterized protein YeaC (DUF1315 family)